MHRRDNLQGDSIIITTTTDIQYYLYWWDGLLHSRVWNSKGTCKYYYTAHNHAASLPAMYFLCSSYDRSYPINEAVLDLGEDLPGCMRLFFIIVRSGPDHILNSVSNRGQSHKHWGSCRLSVYLRAYYGIASPFGDLLCKSEKAFPHDKVVPEKRFVVYLAEKGAYLFLACLSRLAMDHASLPRQERVRAN